MISSLGVVQYGVDYPSKFGTSIPTTRLPENTCDENYPAFEAYRKEQLDWINRYLGVVRSLGYTPWVQEDYIPKGYGACEQWRYAVYFKELETPTGGMWGSGIIGNEADPMRVALGVLGLRTMAAGDFPAGISDADMQRVIAASEAAYNRASVKNIDAVILPSPSFIKAHLQEFADQRGTTPQMVLYSVDRQVAAGYPADQTVDQAAGQTDSYPQEVTQPAKETSIPTPKPSAIVTGGAAPAPSIWDQLKETVMGSGTPTGGVLSEAPTGGLSSIPTWVWLVGGGVVLYLFMGRNKS